MPLYEYQCSECHTRFEKLVRLSDAQALPPCPSCGSHQVTKAVSLFAAFAAGSGEPRGLTSGCGGCAGGGCACSSPN